LRLRLKKAKFRQLMNPGSTALHSLSVVVSVYRSEGTLPTLVDRLRPVLAAVAREYEVVLVNDGSPDRSWEIIEQLAAKNRWVRGIHLMRNYGQHNAVLCGVRAARYVTVVTMDDDLQNPPEEIPKLIAKLGEGYDVVYGTSAHGRQGVWRELASRVTRFALQKAMGVDIARQVSAFRAIDGRVRAAFANYQSPYVCFDVLLTWGTTRFGCVPVRQEPRLAGPSTYTFRKLLTHSMTMMTGFSTWPLQMASLLGFAMTGLGVCILLYVIIHFIIEGGSVPGFPFLASIIAIFSGTQMFALGIMGEYLARMHFRMMERPAYVVSQSTASESEHEK
jgi:glycosyltransferase involved in cell wall biosynthesis